MNGNTELLNYIYQNSQMGIETINKILPIIKDDVLKNQMKLQSDKYKNINQRAKDVLNKYGSDEKGIGILQKITTYIMIDFQTIMDKSSSHISEMFITGSNMGIIQCIKKLNEYPNADKDVVSLMLELKEIEEISLEKLKQLL
ncbi:MAG: hypothetical protein KFW09_05060 [Oscillospiraceae bacterium]|nr:hypothetical protein [Oscillospiraceae bacterium]